MDKLEDYALHAFWNKRRLARVIGAFALIHACVDWILIKTVIDLTVVGAVPRDQEFPHPDSPSICR